MAIGGPDSWVAHGTHGALSSNSDFQDDTRSFDMVIEGESVDATVFGDGFRDKEMSYDSYTLAITYKYSPAMMGVLGAIKTNKETVTWECGPDGHGTGDGKLSGSANLMRISFQVGVGNLLEIVTNWDGTGAYAIGTYS